MNELMIFNNPEFGEIRTIEEDGKTFFCGSDVAKALGYKKPSDAVAAHCPYTTFHGIGAMSRAQGYDVRKIFDANYGEVNTYHQSVWEAVYPRLEL